MADADAVAKKAAIEALLFSPTPSEEQAQREEPRRTSESDLAALQASLGVVDRESRPRSTAGLADGRKRDNDHYLEVELMKPPY